MFTNLFTVSTLTVALLIGGVARSEETPLCHMQKSDGTTINLSELCQHPQIKPQAAGQLDPNRGSDGGPAPDYVVDPALQLVPGQTQKPKIAVYQTPSAAWQQLPGEAKPIQVTPVP